MTAVDLSEEGAVPVTDAQPTQKSILTLLVQALLLNGAAYGAVRNDRSPFRRGLLVLLAILGIVGLARLVGLGLGLLTAPQLGSIQQIVYGLAMVLLMIFRPAGLWGFQESTAKGGKA